MTSLWLKVPLSSSSTKEPFPRVQKSLLSKTIPHIPNILPPVVQESWISLINLFYKLTIWH
jgi:hypothetical protein